MTENPYYVYDFEDYQTKRMSSYIFTETNNTCSPSFYYCGRDKLILYPLDRSMLNPDPNCINSYDRCNPLNIDIENHTELLDTAKKVYFHPSCTIPRGAAAKKYKKCLNPLLADIVVIPGNITTCEIMEYTAIFVNRDSKNVYVVTFETWYGGSREQAIRNMISRLECAPGGTPLINFIPAISKGEVPDVIAKAKLEFFGPVAMFSHKERHILDYLTYALPKNKIVFESSLMKTLGDETNVPTFENLMSIYEMLMSSDSNVSEIGLKALANLDYIHYPQSVMTIIKETQYYLRDNAARTSTAVKYMFSVLGIGIRRYIYYKDKFINRKDYEITEKLIRAIKKYNDDEYLEYCGELPFIFVDENLKPIPRFTD